MQTSIDPKTVSPSKLAHLVYKSRDKRRMLAWYEDVLQARVVFENEFIGFLSYDEEHHRIAVIELPELEGPAPRAVGLHHAAFTYKSLGNLLETYVRLKRGAVLPSHAINHGPTTSIYYLDPDGNRVELQVDNFDCVADSEAWFHSSEFSENPIGVDLDPDELVRRFAEGEPEAVLKRRPNIGPRGLPRR